MWYSCCTTVLIDTEFSLIETNQFWWDRHTLHSHQVENIRSQVPKRGYCSSRSKAFYVCVGGIVKVWLPPHIMGNKPPQRHHLLSRTYTNAWCHCCLNWNKAVWWVVMVIKLHQLIFTSALAVRLEGISQKFHSSGLAVMWMNHFDHPIAFIVWVFLCVLFSWRTIKYWLFADISIACCSSGCHSVMLVCMCACGRVCVCVCVYVCTCHFAMPNVVGVYLLFQV